MNGRTRSTRIAALAGGRGSFGIRLRWLVAAAVVLCLSVTSGSARAAETAKLTVGFAPYRLGVNSAFTFAIKIGTTTGALPSATTSLALRMPASMGLSSSQLGLSVCRPESLLAGGVAGCPHEAVMGSGKAMVIEAANSEQLEVPTSLTLMMAPSSDEKTRLFFFAESEVDLITELLFPGYMTGVANPLATLVDTTITPTVGVPGTPPAAVVSMAVTLAPHGLMYTKRVDGRTVRYHPKGLAVPTVCPHGGLRFEVTLGFADGTHTEAATQLACPSAVGHGTARARGRTARGIPAHGHNGQDRRGR